ncbi:hypothetical protein ANO11243_059920 [Dothideomycetidae sp. 11243]|nr:hypothetical protein ANO11243_059920 [fungal sp. No.11243]
MELKAAGYTACCIIFLIFTSILVPLRCYARIRSISRLAAEDYIMIVAQAVFVLVIIGSFWALANGLGEHLSENTLSKQLEQTLMVNTIKDKRRVALADTLKCFFIAAILYACVMALARISIGMLLFRLMPRRIYKGIVIAAMVLNVSSLLYLLGWTLAVCEPLPHFWERWTPGTCHDKAYGDVGYVHSSCSIAIDWVLSLLPAFVVYRSQLDRKTKLATSAVLGLGVCLFMKPKARRECTSDGTRGRPGRPRQPGDTEVEWDPGLTINMTTTITNDDDEGVWTSMADRTKNGSIVHIETIAEERTDSEAPLRPASG